MSLCSTLMDPHLAENSAVLAYHEPHVLLSSILQLRYEDELLRDHELVTFLHVDSSASSTEPSQHTLHAQGSYRTSLHVECGAFAHVVCGHEINPFHPFALVAGKLQNLNSESPISEPETCAVASPLSFPRKRYKRKCCRRKCSKNFRSARWIWLSYSFL